MVPLCYTGQVTASGIGPGFSSMRAARSIISQRAIEPRYEASVDRGSCEAVIKGVFYEETFNVEEKV